MSKLNGIKRVFIVEDDPITEIQMRRGLRKLDNRIQVDWATNAEEALYRLRDFRSTLGQEFDLIIADIFLDGSTTGIEFWEVCQRCYPDTPVILTSGMTPDSFFRTIGENRISPPFLPKPFNPVEYRKLVEDFLVDSGEDFQWRT